MSDSVRASAACIDISGSFSILRDFFGFFQGQVPPDPTGVGSSVSLRTQIDLLKGDYFHVNVVRFGSDNFTTSDNREIDYSIYKMRNIFDDVDIGVGRVQHWGVLAANTLLENITTNAGARDMTNEFTAPNDGIDVFVPDILNITSSGGGNVLGLSPAPKGPCEDKDDKGMNGSVCGIWGDEQTARTMSHEVGHYLGLRHQNGSPNNLMAQSVFAASTRNSVNLTNAQGNTAGDHCMVDGC